MVDPLRTTLWLYRGLFVALALLLLFLKLLPLGSLAGTLPGPDLLLCLIFAWVLRRPDYLPVLLICAVVLLEDFLLMRPPGLWAGLVIVGTEFIRSRVGLTRELSFPAEWALVGAVMFGLLLAYRLAFTVAFLPQPALGFALLQTLWSVMCYPLVVAASRFAFDLRKPAMGEVDAYGRRL
ncbi:rod shape-determining protein MreD [Paragemmobacter straminiformis]|uniref:Rod shape-determining protein MreD n=1 Tax=Paragemmobacter straminiformis TaxID=2045119 RepID=A0A842IBN4_9RHOB|nr:rod shape-determining protein MreD [Gemmobacter straminiformis]MBC2837031.1 rod shape-determining protein MreD [Gemmobacter straminiformis]